MPTFVITAPSGKEYEITAPEGATREQAFQMLQQQLGAEGVQAQGTRPEEQVGRGMARGIIGATTTLADYLPDPSRLFMPRRQMETLERGRQELREFGTAPSESGYETAGRLVGGALPTGLAGTEVLAARALLPIFGRFAPALGEIAGGAAAGALQPGGSAEGAEAGAITAAMTRAAGRLGVPLSTLTGWMAKHATTATLVGFANATGIGIHNLAWWFALHNNPLSRLAGWAARTGVRAPFAIAERVPGSVAGSVAGQFVGGRNGQVQTPAPGDQPGPPERQPTPIQSDFEALGPAGGRGQPGRDNDSAADQRADSRWQDPNYFR